MFREMLPVQSANGVAPAVARICSSRRAPTTIPDDLPEEIARLDLRQRVTARLVEHGVRPTVQRVEVAMLVLEKPCHFSADQLLASLRRAGIGISKATVYNTLALFCRQGLIREIAVDPTRLMYDSTTRPHHHFYNARTGELIDISPSELRVSRLPALPRATEAESIEVLIRVRPKAPD
jgi:Fur family iron response transcriptional regulator